MHHENTPVRHCNRAIAYIFRILQHFATKHCNFTNFKASFQAVIKDSIFLAQVIILGCYAN